MNIVVVIKQQHEEFRHLIDQVTEAASKDTPEQMRLFREVRSKLNAHGRAEERVSFPRMEEDERTRQAALEAEEWHAASRNVMSR
ncbi:MAG TPA: hemerythrin domain-containing protein, partial [Methanomassiliicoccaceae archaeon]|nr:hemerythrin domain-containing protein [Methanomassiliicoccaceae archaeon]